MTKRDASRRKQKMSELAKTSAGSPADPHAPQWIAQLSDPDPAARSFAAFMLGGLPRHKRRSLPALRRLLLDASDDVAEFAAAALGRLGDTRSLGAIAGRLSGEAPADRWNSAWAAAELMLRAPDHISKTARSALIAYHGRSRGRSRKHAAALLDRVGIPRS